MWHWAASFEPAMFPPVPSNMNIGQWLEESPTNIEEEIQFWIKAYADGLQRVGEAADGWQWMLSGMSFLPTMSPLVKAF